jgi:Tol biopolymer transport system component
MMRKILSYTVLLGMLLWVAGTASAQDGADENRLRWSPDGSQLAFVSNRAGQLDLYVMNVDGSNVRRLTDSLEYVAELVWSPDSKLLAFSSASENRVIWLATIETGEVQPLVEKDDNTLLEWSPDGQWLLYVADVVEDIAEDSGFLHLLNVATGEDRVINADPIKSGYGVWSRDGSKIVVTGNDVTDREMLFIYDVESQALSSNLLQHYWDRNKECCYTETALSPDGTELAFTKSRDGNIYTINLETEVIKPLIYAGGPIQNFYWTADNRIIYLTDWRETDSMEDLTDGVTPGVYIASPEDRAPQLIAEGVGTYIYLSPDEKRVLFQNLFVGDYLGRGQPRALELIDLETFALTEVEILDTNSTTIEWSPDSTQIAAALCVEGDYDIYLIDGVTGTFTNITLDDAFTGEPAPPECESFG